MNLLKHQTEAENHLNEWKVGALFMEPGTGKTRVSVDIVNKSPCDGVFWIGPLQTIRPKDGIPSVKDEVTKWGGFNIPAEYYGIESIQGSDRIYFEMWDKIKAFKNPFIVIDESLKIKNAEAKRTKRLLDISKEVEYKLILNGTPLSRNLLDIWSQMEFLSPLILNMTLNQFKNTFCRITTVTKKIGFYKHSIEYITGYENIDYLYSLIRHYVFECDLHLNVKQKYDTVYYDLSEEERERYKELKEYYLNLETLEWKRNQIFIEMTQAMQHSYCCAEDKFIQLSRLFDTIPEEQTIIFCKFIKSAHECKERYPKATVLSYQKEAYGLNMQHLCHTVYFDKVFNYADRIQSGRRTFRTGQEYDCHYYDMTGDVGLEKIIDRNINKKEDMIEYLKKISVKQLEQIL